MGARVATVAVLSLTGLLLALGSTERERALVYGTAASGLGALEAAAVAHPADPEPACALAQAYLEAGQPGLAVALLRPAAEAPEADVRLRHCFARSLMDDGNNPRALVIETGVVAACRPLADGASAAPGCDRVLFAGAARRVEILRQLVSVGIEDAREQPEASLAAYRAATREARAPLVLQ